MCFQPLHMQDHRLACAMAIQYPACIDIGAWVQSVSQRVILEILELQFFPPLIKHCGPQCIEVREGCERSPKQKYEQLSIRQLNCLYMLPVPYTALPRWLRSLFVAYQKLAAIPTNPPTLPEGCHMGARVPARVPAAGRQAVKATQRLSHLQRLPAHKSILHTHICGRAFIFNKCGIFLTIQIPVEGTTQWSRNTLSGDYGNEVKCVRSCKRV
ncbi:hypothetical protein K458DRAFT_2355 [Lentithecium fluviatile CBS 122367]|uniref:Uncharacterized protein n=1 Tax=Lentithecium fluviatile CBS 122367 TaxID=1168545 RepID=A0A6G1JLW8_9PLEO|nr:hypothetical protein K458DRAFT_2355 [Lentithecium fluviatile CBS 122367]